MAQYIDKDALATEIEKRIKETKSMQPKFDQFWAGQISAFKGILKILDTLEVKEVDIEKEFDKYNKKCNTYMETSVNNECKTFTSLEQSKKLAEILPIESADMHYIIMGDDEDPQSMVGLGEYIGMLPTIPCWSLAALLDIIPYAINISDNKFYRLGIDKGYNSYAIWYEDNGCTVNTLDVKANNFIDACYEMIIRLRKLNLL